MTDMTSRIMGATLQKWMDQPVNVINRTGGGGVIGHLALSQAKPDGYTLGAMTVEITMLHHLGLTELTHSDYTPLALLINNPAAITVRIDAPWDSLPDLMASIRENPERYHASGTARGGIWDLARIGWLQASDISPDALPWVPSQGAAPALQELLAGGVDVVTASLQEVDALRKSGQVKSLAVMAEERLPGFPEVPTLHEFGIDWNIGGWVTISGPPAMKESVQVKLDSLVRLAVADREFEKALTTAGSTIQILTGEDLNAFLAEQDLLHGELIRSSGTFKID
jgi:tripartite-type tricarboxylate transporter receptor subunit TctC